MFLLTCCLCGVLDEQLNGDLSMKVVFIRFTVQALGEMILVFVYISFPLVLI